MMHGEAHPGCSGYIPVEAAILCRGTEERPGRDSLTTEKDEHESKDQKAILCKFCQLPITSSRERLEKDGKHQHTFFNPAGIVYEIGCFRRAPGCLAYGPPSNEFAWFKGYSWQVVYCRSCQQHLGWLFSGDDAFFGLIANKLVEG